MRIILMLAFDSARAPSCFQLRQLATKEIILGKWAGWNFSECGVLCVLGTCARDGRYGSVTIREIEA